MPSVSVYFSLPWSLGTWSVPVMGYYWLTGALGAWSWILPVVSYFAIISHTWYLYQLRFYAEKV